MCSEIKHSYARTNAYKSYWATIPVKFLGSYKDQMRSLCEFIWDKHFPLSNTDNFEYVLVGDQLAWKRNFHLKKYLEDNKIVRFIGNRLILLEHAISYLEEAEIEVRKMLIEIEELKSERMELESENAELESENVELHTELAHMEESKEELNMWHDERMEKLENTLETMGNTLQTFLEMLTPEQKKAVPERHLKLVEGVKDEAREDFSNTV